MEWPKHVAVYNILSYTCVHLLVLMCIVATCTVMGHLKCSPIF
jgi:hypothetical protein